MNRKLKNYFIAKTDPAMAMAIYLEEIDRVVKAKIEEIVTELTGSADKEFRARLSEMKMDLPEISEKISQELKSEIYANFEKFRGPQGNPGKSIQGKPGRPGKSIKGDPGKDGKTPVMGRDYPSFLQVEEMVVKNIPKKEEFEKIIKKLIPKKAEIDASKIARAIEALPTEKKLDYHTGLKNQPESSNQTSSQTSKLVHRGGGMGNWAHEVFPISSATTTVTLSGGVAAEGSAILVRYQGQMLAHQIQYTGPGFTRTITLTFTPQDNTFLEVTYVKG